jgi:hypothetical protein
VSYCRSCCSPGFTFDLQDLDFRDDLESLAYTLLYLLRGDLPWKKVEHGTVLGRLAQVREKKRSWSGSRLAEGYPPVFGLLLDYARNLDFRECPDYTYLRTQFRHAHSSPVHGNGVVNGIQSGHYAQNVNQPSIADSHRTDRLEERFAKRRDCLPQTGQLVHIQIASRESIEGYSIQDAEPSYWRDPELSSSKWHNPARPAIIIDTKPDRWSSCSKILVVSLSQGSQKRATPVIPLYASLPGGASDEKIVPEPTWSMSDTNCYAFPRAYWFHCLPGLV